MMIYNKYCLFILVSFFLQEMNGQKYGDYKWHEYSQSPSIPDSLISSDAVIINNHITIVNDIDGVSRWQVYRKIKILTKQGVEDYAKIFVSKYASQTIAVLDARTIKSSGEIVDLNAEDIKKLDFKDGFEDDRLEELRFMVPGVEVGDEIEVVYQVNEVTFGDDIFFHSYLPVMFSKFTFVTDMKIITDIVSRNGLQDPEVTRNSEMVTYEWKLQNLPAMENQGGAIKSYELPYVTIVIRAISATIDVGLHDQKRTILGNDWASVYERFVNAIQNDMSASAAGKNAMNDLLIKAGVNSEESASQSFYRIFDYIYNEFEIVERTDEIKKMALNDLIAKKKIDEYNLLLLYSQLFDKFKIKYYVCFAKGRYDGDILLDFVTIHDLTDFFFSFYDENGTLHYVFPSNPKRKYRFDELPPTIEGVKSIMVYKRKLDALDSEIEYVQLPLGSYKDNSESVQCKVKFDLNGDKTKVNHRQSVAGASSTLKRSVLANYDGKSEPLFDKDEEIDTFFIEKDNAYYPYNFTTITEVSFDSPLVRVNDTLATIPIGFFIDELDITYSEEERILDYYPLYTRGNSQRFFFEFSSPVKLLNEETISLSTENDIGKVSLLAKQVQPTVIMLSYSYDLTQHHVKKQQYYLLGELNKSMYELRALDLVLKVD